jgi:hypothetical protein
MTRLALVPIAVPVAVALLQRERITIAVSVIDHIEPPTPD